MLSSTFAIFGACFVIEVDNKEDSLPCLLLPKTGVWKGVRYVVVAQSGGAAAVAVLYSLYQANLPAGDGAAGRVCAHRRSPQRHANALDGAQPKQRPLWQLSPHLLPRPLVAVDAGQSAGRHGAGTGAGRSAGSVRRGRHDLPASRQAGLRQSTPPRPAAFHTHAQRLDLGASVG